MSAPTLTPLRRALLAIGARFRSGNDVPVEKAMVPREEWEALCGALDAAPQPPAIGEREAFNQKECAA